MSVPTRITFVDGVTSQNMMSVDGEEIPGKALVRDRYIPADQPRLIRVFYYMLVYIIGILLNCML